MDIIVTGSGKARHGKDTFMEFVDNELKSRGKNGIVFHYADFLKFAAKKWLGWSGEKDEAGRTCLQYWGTDVCRRNRPDCWVTMAKEFLMALGDSIDYVLIPDTRFPNEISVIKEINHRVFKSVNVVRPNFDNGMTEEQKNHPSETALDGYKFDTVILNDAGIEELKTKASQFVDTLL